MSKKKVKNKKKLIIALSVIGIIVLIWIIIATVPKGNNYKYDNPMMKEGRLPILIAHGGGHGEFPDNTLEAFYNAYDADPNVMMETDVSITKDGVVIISHDTTLDRRTNATGKIADWSYTELLAQKVDFSYLNEVKKGSRVGELNKFSDGNGIEVRPTDVPGYPNGLPGRDKEVFLVTTLEDLIVAFPNNRINVEIKQNGETGKRALNAVIELLKKHNCFDRVVLASFHDEIYAEFDGIQKNNRRFMYSPSTGGVVKYVILRTLGLDLFFTDGICVFQIPMKEAGITLATKELVKNAHAHNIAVHYWTIDDPDDMKYLISIGADGIMTNYPHLLKEVYESYKK